MAVTRFASLCEERNPCANCPNLGKFSLKISSYRRRLVKALPDHGDSDSVCGGSRAAGQIVVKIV